MWVSLIHVLLLKGRVLQIVFRAPGSGLPDYFLLSQDRERTFSSGINSLNKTRRASGCFLPSESNSWMLIFTFLPLTNTLSKFFFPTPSRFFGATSPTEPRCLTLLSQLLSALTQANAQRATGPPPWFPGVCWSNRPSELFLLFKKFSTESCSCLTLISLPPIIANVPLWSRKTALIFMEYFYFRALKVSSPHPYTHFAAASGLLHPQQWNKRL